MMRNLGGAISIAALQTFQTKREQFHSNVLMQPISLFQQATRVRLEQRTRYFQAHGVVDLAAASRKAALAIGLRVRQQANILAFSDTFYLLGVALLVALLVTLLLEKPRHALAAGGGH
jgi:DHA2 family multidrug resistance protein